MSTLNRLIINYGGSGWKQLQLNDICILPNPKDSSKLIMFYGGMNVSGNCQVGTAWATVADPLTWTENAANPTLPAVGSGWEGSYIRMGSVVYNPTADLYEMFYNGKGSGFDQIGKATVAPGSDGFTNVVSANWTRDASNPVLVPSGSETWVSQPAVWVEGGTYYMFYSYRTSSATLPGIRLATSTDNGHTWAKQAGDLWTGTPGAYYEFHQIQKIGSTYLLVGELGLNGAAGLQNRWITMIAVSTSLTSGWVQLPLGTVDQTLMQSYKASTIYNVATPALYEIGGVWYLFNVNTAGPVANYNSSSWPMSVFDCNLQTPLLGKDYVLVPGGTVLDLADTMTGSGDITAHASDSGHTYVLWAGTEGVTLSGGFLNATNSPAGGVEPISSMIPGSADCMARMVVRVGTLSGNPEIGVMMRVNNEGLTNATGYLMRFVQGTGFQVFRADNGSFSGTSAVVGSAVAGTLVDADLLEYSVTGSGASITLIIKQNGTQVLSVTDSAATRITGNGKVGIHLYNPGGVLTQNFSVNTLWAGAQSGPATAIVPAGNTLLTTGTQQFSASGFTGAAVTWSVVSGGGSINSSGLYTPSGAGTVTVKATGVAITSETATQTLSVTANITIQTDNTLIVQGYSPVAY